MYNQTRGVLGVDPSQRHTGLCLLTETKPHFHEIRTEDQDVLTSTLTIRRELRKFLEALEAHHLTPDAYAVEKQLSVGGQMSALLFHVQMTILEVIWEQRRTSAQPTLIMPMPVQLQSYTKKRHAFKGKSATDLVNHFKQATGHEGRISQHKVDAYYLAQLGQDVLDGKWEYNLPSKEAPLTPGTLMNGKQPREDKGTPG